MLMIEQVNAVTITDILKELQHLSGNVLNTL